MDDKESKDDVTRKNDVICEFFGIKVTTKNPKLAKILTTDVNSVLQLDVSDVKDFIKSGDLADKTEMDSGVDSKWSSIQDEVDEINELLNDDESASLANKHKK
ncbi:MAG TPA: hypothetical protein ENH19_00125 [Actinobacteria bacterium]|nr:hypothetical protein [Actinomycetes bacterium]HEX21042.1 hypothetical protein [Actinomycetota bacterium]